MAKKLGAVKSIRFEIEYEKIIETVMKRHNLKHSDACRALLVMGADLYTDLERIGIPQTIALFDGIKGRLKEDSEAVNT